MSLIALPGTMFYPSVISIPYSSNSISAARVVTLDAVGDLNGISFQVPAEYSGKSISKIGFRTGTVTTGGDLDVSVQLLDADGLPGGVATGGSTVAETIGAGDDNTWFTSTLGTNHAVTVGEWLCAIVEVAAASAFDGQVTGHRHGIFGAVQPYRLNSADGGGTVNKFDIGLDHVPSMAVGFSDGSWLNTPGMYPVNAGGQETFISTDADAEHGLYFQVPFPCRVVGVVMNGGGVQAGADYSVHLYNSAGVPQDVGANRLATTITIDSDYCESTTLATGRTIYFTSAVTLSKDTWYRIGLEAKTVNNTRLGYFEVDSGDATLMQAMPGGTNYYYTEDDGAGGWTNTNYRMPLIYLIIDQIDDGTGGGGGTPNLLKGSFG
jgi:hypothetical protein